MLTARVLVVQTRTGFFAETAFLCTSETVTDQKAFDRALSEFVGEIPAGIPTDEEADPREGETR